MFRNLGTVDKYGIDGSIAWQIIPEIQLYVYGSYLSSSLRDNVVAGECTATVSRELPARQRRHADPGADRGHRESGAPDYTFGGHIQGQLGPVQFGVQAKRNGRATSTTPTSRSGCAPTRPAATLMSTRRLRGATLNLHRASFQEFPARTPAYTTVDLDIRVPLGWAGLNDDTYFQSTSPTCSTNSMSAISAARCSASRARSCRSARLARSSARWWSQFR